MKGKPMSLKGSELKSQLGKKKKSTKVEALQRRLTGPVRLGSVNSQNNLPPKYESILSTDESIRWQQSNVHKVLSGTRINAK